MSPGVGTARIRMVHQPHISVGWMCTIHMQILRNLSQRQVMMVMMMRRTTISCLAHFPEIHPVVMGDYMIQMMICPRLCTISTAIVLPACRVMREILIVPTFMTCPASEGTPPSAPGEIWTDPLTRHRQEINIFLVRQTRR